MKLDDNYSKKKGPKCRRPTEDELLGYYFNHTAFLTAIKFGVAESTIYAWLRYYKELHREGDAALQEQEEKAIIRNK